MQIKKVATKTSAESELIKLRRKTEIDYLENKLKSDFRGRVRKKTVIKYITNLLSQWQQVEKMFKEHIAKLQKEKDELNKRIEDNIPRDILLINQKMKEIMLINEKLLIKNDSLNKDLEAALQIANDATKQFDEQLKVNESLSKNLEKQSILLQEAIKEKDIAQTANNELINKQNILNSKIKVLSRDQSLLNLELDKERKKIIKYEQANNLLKTIKVQIKELSEIMQPK